MKILMLLTALSLGLATGQRVARAVEAALPPDGINILQANGPGAGQSVQHFHIMPRYAGDEDLKINWGLKRWRSGEMALRWTAAGNS